MAEIGGSQELETCSILFPWEKAVETDKRFWFPFWAIFCPSSDIRSRAAS